MSAKFYVGDVFDVLATLEPASVDLVVTSPPFLALRSYLPADHPDKAREIGSEATPGAFIDRMLDVVEACARVLAPHGSLVFELGDTYAAGSGNLIGSTGGDLTWREGGLNPRKQLESPESFGTQIKRGEGWPLDKSKVLIPQLFAIALAYGFNPLTGRQTEPWRVRNTVAWCRPNPPVGRDGDKFRPATSFLTVACKARDRYWDGDAVRTEHTAPNAGPYRGRMTSAVPGGDSRPVESGVRGELNPAGAPLLDYWVIPTAPYKGSHYATYPPDLVVPLVKSMTPSRVCRVCGKPSTRIVKATRKTDSNFDRPHTVAKSAVSGAGPFASNGDTTYETLGWSDCGHGRCERCAQFFETIYRGKLPGHLLRSNWDWVPCPNCGGTGEHDNWRPGLILDPFCGSGTTLAVASGHGFDCIGIDLDERNADLARERVGGLFLEVETFGSPPAAEALTIEPRFR